ncbi:hypothetical protein BG28_06610 [Nesterenkonia sp. AN1]|uniref:hypothetical protein n=1 Tax=Nesterenkonia sp. AN1 TaxID=652017 RepID=UPI000450AE7F|nr:hypothetical protein [Nesterenkonia sp. AN1]EXF24379.1 hypothetical protein BG28_06610 [Nesterenkonia sp. AN1]
MLFHDRVAVVSREETGWDDYGQPIFKNTEISIPAHVDASTTVPGDESNADQVISRYRVILKFPKGFDVDGTREVIWQGKTLRVDGGIQPQTLRGRIHHHEFVTEKVTG